VNTPSLKERFYQSPALPDCPVYDLHGHMGSWYGIYFTRPDPAQMVRVMERSGVRMLVFCHHWTLFSPDIGNRANVEAVRAFPDRLRAYCGINPNYPDIVKQDVETYDDYSDVYVGFKLLADYHLYPISHDRYRPAWELANERGLLMLLHTWSGSGYDGPGEIRKVAAEYPHTKILLGHSCHDDWLGAVSLVREFPNVYLELCAVLDDRGALDLFVAEIGSERIVFGTDFPWFNHHYYIGAVLGAEMTDEDRRNILYRNAEKLLYGRALNP
jgi:hypothetical protein